MGLYHLVMQQPEIVVAIVQLLELEIAGKFFLSVWYRKSC